ncbi:FMN-binding negative transcriptional regulator [Actinacidiphila acidipaludis]|uniref:FMN-binding negative transcriptional regulator n=1 Tax=Actinacidiphila acidipaludis TaxID=2873382 RepID=A0ABS7QGQ6_9ACTN|nr:FMN-binding negative transcriptional regulator [Streptomyces acidipaludis]MBY8882342.1 FMN-binding negative transcriptional regulator [Streptomyces acidipaludis]
MLIHPWDAPLEEDEWRTWLAAHDFGQLAVNGQDGEPPFVQPVHFAYDPEPGRHGEAVLHLARPNPLWAALQASPRVTLSVVDDYVFVPGPWHAPLEGPTEHGTPTSYYAAVQLLAVAHVLDDPQEKADLLQRQLAHFQPDGGTAPVVPGQAPFGRMLPGIRGVRLEVTAVRAKFKYGGNKAEGVQRRVTGLLSQRGAPHDAAARAHQLRRLAGGDPART